MKNLKIGLLLHFYQPWWQFSEVLAQIVNKCYRPILKLIEKENGFCFSANINYSLLELLDGEFRDVIFGFKTAVGGGKVELLGSTAHHPIMPLIPGNMQVLQMDVDTKLKMHRWGLDRNCRGVYLPEMAFSQSILPNLKKCSYHWTVLDDEVFRFRHHYVPFDRIASLGGFKIFFRSNLWSNIVASGRFSFPEVRNRMNLEIPRWTEGKPAYLILAVDAETFGHHHPQLIDNFLKPMLEEWGGNGLVILTPIKGLSQSFPGSELEEISDCSWAASEDDFRKNDPYPLWNSKFNPYQQVFWELVNLALKHTKHSETRWDCMKIVSSCHWWWISGRPYWKPEFMKFGARKAMKIIKQFGEQAEINEARKIFEKLMTLK